MQVPQETPMILMMHIHDSRARDIVIPHHLTTDPRVPFTVHRDIYGNWCSRIVAPRGRIRLSANAVIRDSGKPDVLAPERESRLRRSNDRRQVQGSRRSVREAGGKAGGLSVRRDEARPAPEYPGVL